MSTVNTLNKSGAKTEVVEFKGLKNCLKLENDKVKLIVTTDIGPRILFYGYKNGQNFFHIFDDQLSNIQPDLWQSYGGHRLWHAPEVYPRTYCPDNTPVFFRQEEDELILEAEPEKKNNLKKIIRIRLEKSGTGVEIIHELHNVGPWDIEVSLWCLSVMASGGRAIIPQADFVPHGEGSGETFLPATNLVLWPFTNMGDPRYCWGEKYIQLRQDDSYESKQKVGINNTAGWAAYALNDELFIKKFDYYQDAVYPDMGVNCELFTMPQFLEVETLSPLEIIKPGNFVSHRENWSLHKGKVPEDDNGIKNMLNGVI